MAGQVRVGGVELLPLPPGAAPGPVKIAIRPESLVLSPAPPAGPALEGRIAKAAYLGTHMEYTVSTPVGDLFVVDRTVMRPDARRDPGVGGLRGPRRHRGALTPGGREHAVVPHPRPRPLPRPLGPHLHPAALGDGRPGHQGGAARRGRRRRRRAARLRLPEPPPEQAQHHAEPEDRGRPRGHLPAGAPRPTSSSRTSGPREAPPRHRLRHAAGRSTRGWSTSASPASARPALRRPGGARPDRPGPVRLHDRQRVPRAGPAAGRASDRRPHRRPDGGLRRDRGAPGARALRPGPVGPHLAAPGDDAADGPPGRALAHRRRGPAPGRQLPPGRHADGRLQVPRRQHDHPGRRPAAVPAALPGDRRARADRPTRGSPPARPAASTARR